MDTTQVDQSLKDLETFDSTLAQKVKHLWIEAKQKKAHDGAQRLILVSEQFKKLSLPEAHRLLAPDAFQREVEEALGYKRLSRTLNVIRIILGLAPLIVTWASISLAVSNYPQYLNTLQIPPGQPPPPFLKLWQDGFPGDPLTFSLTGFIDVGLLVSFLFFSILTLLLEYNARSTTEKFGRELENVTHELMKLVGTEGLSRVTTDDETDRVFAAVKRVIQDTFDVSKQVAEEAKDAILKSNESLADLLNTQIKPLVEHFNEGLSELHNDLEKLGTDLDIYQERVGDLTTASQDLVRASNVLVQNTDKYAEVGKEIDQHILALNTTQQTMVTRIEDTQLRVVDRIDTTQKEVANTLVVAQSNLANKIETSQSNVANRIEAAQREVAATISTTQSSVAETIATNQNRIADRLEVAQREMVATISAVQSSVVDTIVTTQNKVADRLEASQRDVVNTIADTQQSVAAEIRGVGEHMHVSSDVVASAAIDMNSAAGGMNTAADKVSEVGEQLVALDKGDIERVTTSVFNLTNKAEDVTQVLTQVQAQLYATTISLREAADSLHQATQIAQVAGLPRATQDGTTVASNLPQRRPNFIRRLTGALTRPFHRTGDQSQNISEMVPPNTPPPQAEYPVNQPPQQWTNLSETIREIPVEQPEPLADAIQPSQDGSRADAAIWPKKPRQRKQKQSGAPGSRGDHIEH